MSLLLQVLSDPRQKRFFKSKDMRDLFTLGDEYANATETSEIFASVNGGVTATLAAGQAPLPELNHAEGLLCTQKKSKRKEKKERKGRKGKERKFYAFLRS